PSATGVSRPRETKSLPAAREPNPERSGARARYPRLSRRETISSQHQAPCQAPWTRTNCGLLMGAFFPFISNISPPSYGKLQTNPELHFLHSGEEYTPFGGYHSRS